MERQTPQGAVLGLLAAALFGVSAPLAKLLLGELRPQLLAGLLYLGAGIGLSIFRVVRPNKIEFLIQRSDVLLILTAATVIDTLALLVALPISGAAAGSECAGDEAAQPAFIPSWPVSGTGKPLSLGAGATPEATALGMVVVA